MNVKVFAEALVTEEFKELLRI